MLVIVMLSVSRAIGSTSDEIVAFDLVDYPLGPVGMADHGSGWKNRWKLSRKRPPFSGVISAGKATEPDESVGALPDRRAFVIRGTGSRNNPLRREVAEPITRDEVFICFDLHYRGPVETAVGKVDPEFFVLWMDQFSGEDQSTHANNVPNIGVHQATVGPKKGRNVFMVRIGSSKVAWSEIEIDYDRSYRVVGRLKKKNGNLRGNYDQIDLWVDPEASDLDSPDATISQSTSVNLIRWIGFSTGLKTEPTDKIFVSDIRLGVSWQSMLGDSPHDGMVEQPKGYKGRVWDKPIDFARDVYPLLRDRCFDCHAGINPESGYRLDLHGELLGYSNGEVLAEPGRSHRSRLIEAVTSASADKRMPPDEEEPLSDQDISKLIAWIDQGLQWDNDLLPPQKVRSDHWAFQSIRRPKVPDKRTDWVKTPVDAFIAQAHRRAGVKHADQASREVLVRRLYLDLIGLPPMPGELDAALKDDSPNWTTRLVDQLLQSPHYGERWARRWLDLARWAESQGYQHDIVRPFAWRYRDYVINAFNQGKPYDRFIREQIAGDELLPYSDENLIATGFLGAARISGNQSDDAIQRNDVLVDIVNATGSAILGLTLECAQCHNHKFDPISQRDYYRLQAFFVSGQLGNLALREPDAVNPTDLERWIPKPALAFYRKEVKTLLRQKQYREPDQAHTWGFLSPATNESNIKRLSVVNRNPIEWDPEALRESRARMLIRGDVANPGPEVQPGWPEVLSETPISLGTRPRSSLSDWLADPSNPLVARVWVNRLWQSHFGRGIVTTSSDFGVEGSPPTHPELLDWLASELIDNDWDTRSIHRIIVCSATYQQERKFDTTNAKVDPENHLLWNWPRQRLEAETIRDSILVATGELDRGVGGVSVPPEREEQQLRRTIYLFQQRSNMPTVMEMFDAPTGIASCSRRHISTVALQPLFMLNSQFMTNRVNALTEVIMQEAGLDENKQIDVLFRRTLSRLPEQHERELALQFLSSGTADVSGLSQLCLAMLNLNEFVYVP